MIYLFAIATFCFTLLGGLFALKFRDRLHLILAFSAGSLLGVAFFDLLPESIQLANGNYQIATITTIVAAGFLLYMVLNNFFTLHPCEEGGCENHSHKGQLGAGSLSVHSFLDGMAIGLGFQVSSAVGLIIAAAVLTHDFSDGINTISIVLKNQGNVRNAFKWLIVDAVAPVLGILSTLFFTLPEKSLGLILALFCGFFLYIGASDLLPESHHKHPGVLTALFTLLGAGLIFLIVRLA